MHTKIPNSELEIYKRISNDFKVVFDVGCRTDIDYYHINTTPTYHLFEPNTSFTKELKEKISKLSNHNIIVNEVGLSDINKDDCTYYSNVQSFTPHWQVVSVHELGDRFPLRRLDDYVTDNNVEHIDFLKIDVEGLDYNVLSGGSDTFKNKTSFIQFECSGDVKKYVTMLDESFDLYMMVEPALFDCLQQYNFDVDFNTSLIKLDDKMIDFMDNTLGTRINMPGNATMGSGCGYNIFCINKSIKYDINDLIFNII